MAEAWVDLEGIIGLLAHMKVAYLGNIDFFKSQFWDSVSVFSLYLEDLGLKV